MSPEIRIKLFRVELRAKSVKSRPASLERKVESHQRLDIFYSALPPLIPSDEWKSSENTDILSIFSL